jgi:hypothetical protein
VAVIAAYEGWEGRIHVLQALAPKPTRRSGGAPRQHQGQNFPFCTLSDQLLFLRNDIPK